MPMDQINERIRLPRLRERLMSPEAAAALFRDGMTVGMSGFTRAGDCKAVPFALAERAAHEPLRITLMTGASLGNDIDKVLTEARVIATLKPWLQGRTVLMSTHRPQLLEWADTIAVIDAGQCVAFGEKQEMLEKLTRGIDVKAGASASTQGVTA